MCVTLDMSQEPRCCVPVSLSLRSGEFIRTLSHMWQLVFAYFSIQGWFNGSEENVLFD